MTYTLSLNSVLSTMRALAAMSILSAPEDIRQPLADIIMADRRDLHVRLAKDAFAEMLIREISSKIDLHQSGALELIRSCDWNSPFIRKNLW